MKHHFWMVMYNWKGADRQKWPEYEIFGSEAEANKWIDRFQALHPDRFEYHISEMV